MDGRTLGHYRILEQLGRGGVGEVYRAEDSVLKRQVALKVLREPLAQRPDQLKRFQREAETLAALDHPNIVSIHSVEEADGLRFLTMELIEGRVLSDIIPAEGMPLREVASIGVDLAAALAAAHSKGVIHRDLKPKNIMVTSDGRTKVLDFGLAKLHELIDDTVSTEGTTETLSDQGRLVGTIHYMSPEQAKGGPVGPRSDIFALGVILFEMSTGERPFQGDSKVSVLSAILSETPPPVWKLRTEQPFRLGRIIQRALSKDAEKRQETAEEIRDQLQQVETELSADESHSSGTISQILHGSSWITVKRNQLFVGMALVLGLALAVLWAVLRDTTRILDRLQVDHQEALVTWPSGEEAGAISPSGDAWAFISNRGGAEQIWIGSVGGSEPRAVRSGASKYRNPVWSPDGQQLAFLEASEGEVTLVVVSLWGEEVRQPFAIARSIDDVGLVCWRAGGVYFYLNDTERRTKGWLWRFDLAAERMEQITDPESDSLFEAPDHVIHVDVSHDERKLVWVSLEAESSDLFTSDLGGLHAERLTTDPSRVLSPRWMGPDDSFVAYISNESGQFDIWILDPGTGERRPLTSSPLEESNLSVSAAGNLLTADVVRERSNLWAVRADGNSAPVQITNDTRIDIWPSAALKAPTIIFHRSRSALEAGFSPFETEILLMPSLEPGAIEPIPLVENGFGGKLSSDGSYVAFLRIKLVESKSRISLWVQSAERTGRPFLVTGNFVASPILFDTWSWMWDQFAWGPTAPKLYFVERGEGETECIVEVMVAPTEITGRRELLCSEDADTGFGDLVVSPDTDRLAYVRKKSGLGSGGSIEVVALQDPSRPDLIVNGQMDSDLHVVGWKGEGSLIVLIAWGQARGAPSTDVLSWDAGEIVRIGQLSGVRASSVVANRLADTLFFARNRSEVWDLVSWHVDDRSPKSLVENQLPGISFPGIAVTRGVNILFSKKEQGRDIWRIAVIER